MTTFVFCAALKSHAEVGSFSIEYEAENDYLSAGTATWSLQKKDAQWVMQLATKPSSLVRLAGVGKVVETSVLSSLNPPFQASFYSYTDSKRKKKNFSAALSDAATRIVVTRAGQTTSIPADGTVIDRLSATLAVSRQLIDDPDFETLTLKVLDRKGVRDLIFTNLGRTTLAIGNRSFDAYVVESGRPGGSRKTKTWFASLVGESDTPKLLPVKIEQYKRQDLVLRLSLKKHTIQ